MAGTTLAQWAGWGAVHTVKGAAVTTPAEPAAKAFADRGWRIDTLPPDPVPPEVLDLFPAGSLKLLEEFALCGPPGRAPGTIELVLGTLRGQPLVVVLREGQCPDVIKPVETPVGTGVGTVLESGAATAGTVAFSFEAGAHDDGARLLLLAVRAA